MARPRDYFTRPRVELSTTELASRNRRIARAVKYGCTIKDAARRFKLDHRTIAAICASYGVKATNKTSTRGWA
jgi:DNA-binding NarL/FixJ family response regulator